MLKLANAGLAHAHAHHTRHKELFSPVLYRTLSSLGPLPSIKFSIQVPKMCTAGQRVSLTITGPEPSSLHTKL